MKAERFVWGTVVQLLSFVRVDVIHHSGDILLSQFVKTFAFRKDPSYELMVDFNGSLLVRLPGITVEYMCSSITDLEVLASLRNASIKLNSTKWMVKRHLPPCVPITVSI